MKLGEGTTPGPWNVAEITNNRRESLNLWEVINADNHYLTQVGPYPNAEANARLIAKAPLLIECRDVLENINDLAICAIQDVDPKRLIATIQQQIRALLAKLEA